MALALQSDELVQVENYCCQCSTATCGQPENWNILRLVLILQVQLELLVVLAQCLTSIFAHLL